MPMIPVFALLFVGGGFAIVFIVLLSQQFLARIQKRSWRTRTQIENMYTRQLAKELEVVYLELAWKNKRLMELSSRLQKQNDDIKRHSEFQGRLFAMISHDLRNAVGSVYSSLAFFFRQGGDKVSGPLRRYLDIAYSGSEHVKYLAESLTEFINLNREEMKIHRDPIDMNLFFEQIYPRFSFEAEKKGLTLDWSVAPSLPGMMGDAGKLAAVFNNLLHNALKFTPAGGRVSLAVDCPDSTILRCAVRDSGVGILPEDVDKIFGEFYRSKTTENVKQKGWGLGLAIVRQIVSLHEGRITVESPGRGYGATFTVYLPARADLAAAGNRGGDDAAAGA